MIKEFVPYEQALALKELGFDEPCFGGWNFGEFIEPDDDLKCFINIYRSSGEISAPLWQQAFRWFRLKYELDCSFEDEIVFDDDENEIEMWDFFIYKSKQVDDKVMKFCSNNFNTYIECFSKEEAKLECLKKLIEIVKSK